MNDKPKKPPSKPLDFVVSLLGLKFRHREPGIDNFPKIYRRGPNVVVCAHGYWTPFRFRMWRAVCKGLVVLAQGSLGVYAVVAFCLLFPLLSDEPLFIPGYIALAVFASLSGIVWILTGSPIRKPLGKALLGKRTVVEYFAHKVVIYRHGYGFSFPISMTRSANLSLSNSLDPHIRARDSEELPDEIQNIYGDSVSLDIIQGTNRKRVADIYGQGLAERLKIGLDEAERIRSELAQRRWEEKRIADLQSSSSQIQKPSPPIPRKSASAAPDLSSRWDD